jgi:hypothetical protein
LPSPLVLFSPLHRDQILTAGQLFRQQAFTANIGGDTIAKL